MTDLMSYIKKNGKPTIRSIAEILDMPVYRLYRMASPIETKSMELIDAIEFRLNDQYPTVEKVLDAALKLDAHRNIKGRPKAKGSPKTDFVVVDGNVWPALRDARLVPGALALLQGDDRVFQIVYQTVSHSVLRAVDAEGQPASEQLLCLTNKTFNSKMVAPGKFDLELMKRRDPT